MSKGSSGYRVNADDVRWIRIGGGNESWQWIAIAAVCWAGSCWARGGWWMYPASGVACAYLAADIDMRVTIATHGDLPKVLDVWVQRSRACTTDSAKDS